MATPSGVKRQRLIAGPSLSVSPAHAQEVSQAAQSEPFPWKDAVPENIAKWFEMYAKSRNTLPEFVFTAALTTVASLMGPKVYVRLRKEYPEPVNLFTICMAEPGAGKSQAFRMSIIDPLMSLNYSNILVDEYTRRGLFRHLQQNSGRGLLAYEELTSFFDQVHRRQLEGTLNKEGSKEEVREACICICGFLQPGPFVQRILPTLLESNDGFADRLLLCSPQPELLMEKEVEEWCERMRIQQLEDLCMPYKLIAEAHQSEEDMYYEYDAAAKEVCFAFSDEMTTIMNEQWKSRVSTHGNVSKDKRTMIRLSGVLHVLYHTMRECLENTAVDSSPSLEEPSASSFSIPSVIPENVARMAVHLTEYYQSQRMAYEKGIEEASNKATEIEAQAKHPDTHILLSKGPFCTPRSVIKNMTTKARPRLDEIAERMKKLAERDIGAFVIVNQKERAFYKPLPTEDKKIDVCNVIGDTRWSEYIENFKAVDTKYITVTQYNRLMASSPFSKEDLLEYGVSARES